MTDPRTWDISQWGLAIAILGLLFAFTQPFGFLLQWRQYTEDKLEQDPILRQEWAERLRNRSMGAAYRDALARSLAWLDRVFGPPGSAQALGVCFLIAVAYAWVTFFLGWGFFHGAGHIGGLIILPQEAAETDRQIGASFAILLPPATFYLTRWLARCVQGHERNLQARLLQRWKRKLGRQRFKLIWCLFSAGLVFVVVMQFSKSGVLGSIILALLFFFMLPFWGILSGRWVQRYFKQDLWANLAVYAVAGVLVLVLVLAVFAVSIVGAVVGAVVGVVVGFGAGTVVGAVAGAGAGAGGTGGTDACVVAAGAAAAAAAVGTALGLARRPSDLRGVWAGGLGGLQVWVCLRYLSRQIIHLHIMFLSSFCCCFS